MNIDIPLRYYSLMELLWPVSELYKQLRGHKAKNPDLKILLAVGGWNAGSSSFVEICRSASTMQTFAENVVKFLRDEDFDGFDLDWEYPSKAGAGGKQMMTDLAQVSVIKIDVR